MYAVLLAVLVYAGTLCGVSGTTLTRRDYLTKSVIPLVYQLPVYTQVESIAASQSVTAVASTITDMSITGPPVMGLPDGGRTLVYSTVHDHDIKLDYYLPSTASGRLQALIYFHGGGMTSGSRRDQAFPQWLYDHCQRNRYISISADYRLCHPSTALDQIEDAKSLFNFLAGSFQRELPENVSLDTRCIAVTGFSAGAYPARAACVYAKPRPAVLMTIYGTGSNLLLDHWVAGRPPTSIAKFVDLDSVPKLLVDKTVFVGELDGTFLDGCFGKPGLGKMLNAVQYATRAAAIPEDIKPGFLQLFVAENYPPSVVVHGTADEVVSADESVTQHEQLKNLGIRTELLVTVSFNAYLLVDSIAKY